MRLDKIIKDLKDMRKAGFIDCNIQCLLDKLEKAGFGWVFNSPGVEVTEVEEG